MITIGRFDQLNEEKYDECWMIVRAPDELPVYVRHVPQLSPSPDLFSKYRAVYDSGTFDSSFFQNIYVPQFISELRENDEGKILLRDLSKTDKNIFLGCYCENEALCHRSIVAGILLGMGADIQTDTAYLKYYEMFTQK